MDFGDFGNLQIGEIARTANDATKKPSPGKDSESELGIANKRDFYLALAKVGILLILAIVEMVAGIQAFMEFNGTVNKTLPEEGQDNLVYGLLITWSLGISYGMLIEVSEVFLLVYIVWQLTIWYEPRRDAEATNVIYFWTLINSILQFICEDAAVSMVRLLLAAVSVEMQELLVTKTEQTASIIVCVVTFVRLVFGIGSLIHGLYKSRKCSWKMCDGLARIVFGSLALIAATASMTVCIGVLDVSGSVFSF